MFLGRVGKKKVGRETAITYIFQLSLSLPEQRSGRAIVLLLAPALVAANVKSFKDLVISNAYDVFGSCLVR